VFVGATFHKNVHAVPSNQALQIVRQISCRTDTFSPRPHDGIARARRPDVASAALAHDEGTTTTNVQRSSP
jgi:hypothetical protein